MTDYEYVITPHALERTNIGFFSYFRCHTLIIPSLLDASVYATNYLICTDLIILADAVPSNISFHSTAQIETLYVPDELVVEYTSVTPSRITLKPVSEYNGNYKTAVNSIINYGVLIR